MEHPFPNVNGLGRIGGIASITRINGNIENCANYGFVKGDVNGGGGICELANNSTVFNCINIAVVVGGGNVGCIVGELSNRASIIKCYYDKQMCGTK